MACGPWFTTWSIWYKTWMRRRHSQEHWSVSWSTTIRKQSCIPSWSLPWTFCGHTWSLGRLMETRHKKHHTTSRWASHRHYCIAAQHIMSHITVPLPSSIKRCLTALKRGDRMIDCGWGQTFLLHRPCLDDDQLRCLSSGHVLLDRWSAGHCGMSNKKVQKHNAESTKGSSNKGKKANIDPDGNK